MVNKIYFFFGTSYLLYEESQNIYSILKDKVYC